MAFERVQGFSFGGWIPGQSGGSDLRSARQQQQQPANCVVWCSAAAARRRTLPARGLGSRSQLSRLGTKSASRSQLVSTRQTCGGKSNVWHVMLQLQTQAVEQQARAARQVDGRHGHSQRQGLQLMCMLVAAGTDSRPPRGCAGHARTTSTGACTTVSATMRLPLPCRPASYTLMALGGARAALRLLARLPLLPLVSGRPAVPLAAPALPPLLRELLLPALPPLLLAPLPLPPLLAPARAAERMHPVGSERKAERQQAANLGGGSGSGRTAAAGRPLPPACPSNPPPHLSGRLWLSRGGCWARLWSGLRAFRPLPALQGPAACSTACWHGLNTAWRQTGAANRACAQVGKN